MVDHKQVKVGETYIIQVTGVVEKYLAEVVSIDNWGFPILKLQDQLLKFGDYILLEKKTYGDG